MATATARRGLVPRGVLSPFRVGPPRAPMTRTTPALARTAASVRDLTRTANVQSNRMMMRQDQKSPAPSAEMAGLADKMRNMMLLPGTFVPLPLSKWPMSPLRFFKYLYARLRTAGECTLMTWGFRLSSMPKGTFRPRFKPQTRQIVPTARALHRRLNEAIAAGDLASLREVCHEPLYNILARTVAGRKKGETLEWAVVKSHSPLLLPRTVFHRAAIVPDSRWGQQSAVVRFDTTQRLTRRGPDGEPVKGGAKAQRKTENMVIMRSVDGKNYEPEEWKVWGFEEEMTLEAWEEMKRGEKILQNSGLEARVAEIKAAGAKKARQS
ncbi:uncharacterized protein DNG_02613 [Cephalotrichum gorgonifer]|uniref:Large ribosomal subunit protein mL45 n=1 Tax=Cephalotrichum gorgonifer TaxID=2041049 RepID=A0AAE8MTV9_9PEZI|nr:uncharacterized protein DNG_02613 [Cephalotrichum gorgonifer]